MVRNMFGRTLATELRLADVQARADAAVGTAKRPETRGKRLAEAGFSLAELAGQHKRDLMAYWERNRELAAAGKCRAACDLVRQANGLQVCRLTGEPCNRQELEALASAWGVVNQSSGEGSALCLMPGLD